MCLRLADPQAHLQNFAETMVHNAMQEHGYAQLQAGTTAKPTSSKPWPSPAQRSARLTALQSKNWTTKRH
jgi:hypothetical protein